jgi:hypothetical protein
MRLEWMRDEVLFDRGDHDPVLVTEALPVRYYADRVEITEAEYRRLLAEQDADTEQP